MTATAMEQLGELLADADRPRPPALDEPIRFSRLKRMAASPAHYAFGPDPDSSAIDVGSAAHAMILGGKPVIFYPGKVRNGKAWDQFEAENAGKIILTRREYVRAAGMANAVQENMAAMRVLDGEREMTLTWRQNKRLCQGTPDVRGDSNGERFITELKTGETSDPRIFPWKLKRMAYHAQLGWYSDGAALAGLGEPQVHYVVAVEAAPPHVVTVFRVTLKTIEKGKRLVRLWFERLQQCEAANQWPPYSQTTVDLDLPDDFDEELNSAEVAAAAPDWATEAL